MRTPTATVAALAALLLAGAAAAETVPLAPGLADEGWSPGDPGRAEGATNGGGTFVDFAVPLEAGRDYFLAGVSDVSTHRMELRGPGGAVLRSEGVRTDGVGGFEYRAAATATYFLRIVQDGGAAEEGGSGLPVVAFAGPDCRADTRTACGLRVGTAARGRWDFTESGDPAGGEGATERDAYELRLVAGRRYEVSVQAGAPRTLAVADAKGRQLAYGAAVEPVGDGGRIRLTFRPTRTGDYWVRTTGRYDRAYYDLLVR